MSGARASMYSENWQTTNQDQLNKANEGLASDTTHIGDQIQSAISQGMGLYNNTGTQGQVTNALANNNALQGQSNVAPGSVDLSNYQPYMQAGQNALNSWQNVSGVGGMNSNDIYQNYFNNPATQFQMDQGNRQINSNAASKGMLGSGAILKSLQSYGQGIASQGLGAYQSNLANMAGMGATAANQYAASLLNKYSTDQQAAVAGMQNKTALAGQQAGLINANANNTQGQASLLQNLTNSNANQQAAAAIAKQQALVGGATKYGENDQMGFGGTFGTETVKYQG